MRRLPRTVRGHPCRAVLSRRSFYEGGPVRQSICGGGSLWRRRVSSVIFPALRRALRAVRGHRVSPPRAGSSTSIQHPVSSIQHPASSILYPAFPAFLALRPLSSVLCHLTSVVCHLSRPAPSPSTHLPASSIQYPASLPFGLR